MADVVTNSTSLMTDKDLHSIAAYLKDQPASPSDAAQDVDAGAMRRGKAIYDDVCASCHMLEGGGQPRVFPPIAGNFMLQQRDPSGLIHLILAGGRTAPTPTRPTSLSMPSFAWKLTDQQIADVATYIRNSWGNRAEPVDAGPVAAMRKRLGLDVIRRTENSGDSP
jgi:mono/diheme cytochrome c family protein